MPTKVVEIKETDIPRQSRETASSGKLPYLESTTHLPVGTFESITVILVPPDEELSADFYDALWDKKFAESQDLLSKLSNEAHEEYLAGLTEEFDPDNYSDMP